VPETAAEISVRRRRDLHPMAFLVGYRIIAGVGTLVVVSLVVFAATEILPGNAAYAILGHSATPQRVHALEVQLHLDRSVVQQYWLWLSGILTGHLGTSLVNSLPVWSVVEPRLVNSAALVFAAGVIGSVAGIGLGALAAFRKDGWLDRILSPIALAVTSLPEFVIAIGLVLLLATSAFHVLPGVSLLAQGVSAWSQPRLLVLPVATLVIVIAPYIYRMMRAAMIEALESDYVEMALLKGASTWRVVLWHACPNAIAPTIQVIGLSYLYLAGGIVVVETVFDFPGVGLGLVNAVTGRDLPVIQLIVLVLAAFYVFMNIVTDVIALAASPRRRVTQ
jgi:peptide/nickel transport system permease protein